MRRQSSSRYNRSILQLPSLKSSVALAGICCAFGVFVGCAVPLGPGYSIQKQTLELRDLPSPQPHLSVHASFALKNSGNQPLSSIRILLPPAAEFHRAATSARWNDQPVELQVVSTASLADRGDALEVRLPHEFAVKKQGDLILDYELATGSHLGSFLAASPESFYAYSGSWNPTLLPPKHLFGVGGAAPKKWAITVRVPAGYLVHASGTIGKTNRSSGEWTYMFTQQARSFAPFAAGGKYVEHEVKVDGQRILVWTYQPVDAEAVQRTATEIASRARYYESEYGSPATEDRTVHLLECAPPPEQFGCGALPQTILVHQNWVARGLSEAGFHEDANFELAYTWFGGASRVRLEESPLPMDALAPYAGWEAEAFASGGSARARRIKALIADFDKQVASCKEKIILPTPAGFSGCSYPAAWTKSGLFFFAVEDKLGRGTLHAALKQLLESRRGRDFNVQDFIAVVDAESQQPQGPFIRAWLKHSGIPDDFRARYAGQATAASASSEANSIKEHQP